jgi:gas vesicle protein
MIVTIVVTLTTSQFKTFGKLTPDMMTGLAIGGILGCVVWLVFAIKRISRKTSKTISANIMRQAQDEQNVRISGTLAGRSTLAGALTVERGEPK